MRAIVLRAAGGPEALRLEQTPDPEIGPDDCLVRVRAAAVCGRDLIDRRGGFPMMKLPTILGHEFSGELVAVGERAQSAGFAIGDRVVNLHRPSCMACAACLAGKPLACERAWQSFGHTVDGGYAELVAAHHRALVKIPAALPHEIASTLMCTAGVALRALRDRGRLALGETVLVTGASGGVGTAAVQIARRMGARVIAVTGSEAKRDRLAAIGAHEVVVSPDGRFSDEVRSRTDGGVHLALELTGSATFNQAMRSCRRGGRVVVAGNIEANRVELQLGALILHGYDILGTASCTPADVADVVALAVSGELAPQIDRTLPLERAAEAHRLLADRSVFGRVVLLP